MAKKNCCMITLKQAEIFCLGVVLLSIAVGAYFYPLMPAKVASHWNEYGQVNDYMDKFWAMSIMPLVSIFLLLLLLAIPRIDPLKENIAKFRSYFDGFIALIFLFLFYIYLLTILWNLGVNFDMIQVLSPALGILFYYCGILIEHAKRNWFIGIRTPWTMTDEIVWDKTHALGGKLFKISGIIAVLGIFEFYAFYLAIVPVILSTIYAVAFSYFEFQRQARKTKKKRK
jgi:uncharacterized membrane protein